MYVYIYIYYIYIYILLYRSSRRQVFDRSFALECFAKLRSSRLVVLCKKGVLTNFAKFTEKLLS